MNKTILVTGSSRGIGKAIALYLANKGFDLVIHYRSQIDQAEGVVKQINQLGQAARLVQFDISDRKQCAEIIKNDIEVNGAYYGVVCNAGVISDNAFPLLSGEDWDSVVHTNLDGFYNVLHPIVMPMIMRHKPGRIVTLSSVSGIMGNRGQVNYSAAKAGIIGATKALALELAKRNITVNCVAPGLIETEIMADLSQDEITKIIPAQRVGNPKEVAAAVAFFMSEDAGYITRQVLSVNGGLC